MSESENTPTPPPPSTPKTAAVPLKKETVRITLRARPGAGATQPREATSPVLPVSVGIPAPDITPKRSTAPIQLPSAPLPPPAPKSATAPVKLPPAPVDVSRKTTAAVPVVAAPAPSAPPPPAPPAPRPLGPPPAATVPTAPPRPPGAPAAPVAPGAPPAMARPPVPSAPGAPRPPGAPPVAPGAAPVAPGAPRVETGATTAPLRAGPAKPGVSAPRPAGTAPLAAAPGAGTGALPKATVKLQQTQPMSRPSISAPPSAPVKRTAAADSQQFYEEKDPEEGLMPLSVVCLLFSVVLLVVQMFGSDSVSSSADSPIMVPPPVAVKWESLNADKSWSNNFITGGHLPALPQ